MRAARRHRPDGPRKRKSGPAGGEPGRRVRQGVDNGRRDRPRCRAVGAAAGIRSDRLPDRSLGKAGYAAVLPIFDTVSLTRALSGAKASLAVFSANSLILVPSVSSASKLSLV